MGGSTQKEYGIQEVYRPAGIEAEVDVVAVHGLTGDSLKTWTAKKTNICWLFHPEFLPRYVKNARVLVWGYNASISAVTKGTTSSNRIHHHAQTLVAQLYADRKLERRVDKPIIFVCHSLGGIIVKRALSYSSTQTSDKVAHMRSIFNCTYGILFFGTPHHGSSKARLLVTLQKLASIAVPIWIGQFESNLLSALEEESETLQNITDYFVPMMKNFCIYFFWEQEKTNLKFTQDYIVDQESAAPTVDDTERAGIAADHVGMVKFDKPTSQGFRLVAAALSAYCEEAPEVIRNRWAETERTLAELRRREAMERIRRIPNSPYKTPEMGSYPHSWSASSSFGSDVAQ